METDYAEKEMPFNVLKPVAFFCQHKSPCGTGDVNVENLFVCK